MEINDRVQLASKWSFITEILSKLVVPITNMFTARLLTPEAFGLVATITMVTSFADIFADAGFQKYLIQKEFKNDEELNEHTNVAFWTNIIISIVIWTMIFIFKDSIAVSLGSEGLGVPIVIASLSLPLTSFSSIQMARFRRSLDFKTLFLAKTVGIFLPLVVTIPLSFILRNYWALIIGTLCVNFSNAVLFTIKSSWKPSLSFDMTYLKDMFSFSIWTMIEQLLGWANANIGIFIVGSFLSTYYLGLYKTSMASTNQLMYILINAISPVLFSTLSRLKNDDMEFKKIYYSFQQKIAMLVVPLGVGLYVYRDIFTKFLLGNQWIEAADFIGLWGLMRSMHIMLSFFSVQVFVSLGKPKYSVLSQSLNLLLLIPTLFVAVQFGYRTLYITRSLIVLVSITIELLLLKRVAKLSPMTTFKNSIIYISVAILMGGTGFFLRLLNTSLIWQFFSVLLCVILYFGVLSMKKIERKKIKAIISLFIN